jgi:hypothetical protein
VTVSWRDVMVWCNAYSEKSGKVSVYTSSEGAVIRNSSSATCDNAVMDKTKSGFRLPTEVEWEFAFRGGNPSDTTNWAYPYAGSDTAGDVAWYSGNSGATTHPVGTKVANSLGLYDMNGNVWEWCWDRSASVSSSTPADGEDSGTNRMSRGGSWYSSDSVLVSRRVLGPPVVRPRVPDRSLQFISWAQQARHSCCSDMSPSVGMVWSSSTGRASRN